MSNKDDPETPAGTIRAWTIGLTFVVILSFVNQFFSLRQPAIRLDAAVVQLLSFPVGKAWEKWLPVGEFTLFGSTLQLNPGKFNKKEHMLISIMANVGYALPHSRYLVSTSWLEKYFNFPFAGSFGFQITLAVSESLRCVGVRSTPCMYMYMYSVQPLCLTRSCLDRHEPYGLWDCWPYSPVPGLPFVLRLASFPRHRGPEPVFAQW